MDGQRLLTLLVAMLFVFVYSIHCLLPCSTKDDLARPGQGPRPVGAGNPARP